MLKFVRVIQVFIVIFFCGTPIIAQEQQTIDSLLRLLETGISDKEKVDTYISIAKAYTKTDSVNTVKYADLAIELANKIEYPEGKIDARYILGKLNYNLDHFATAEGILLQVIEDAKAINYLSGQDQAFSLLGLLSRFKGNYELALDCFLKCLEINKKMDVKFGIGNTYNSIGTVYTDLSDFEKALEYYFRSLEIFLELDEKKGIARSYNNISLVHIAQGDYEKALEYQFQALDLSIDSGNYGGISTDYNNIGYIFYNLNQYDSAYVYYQKAIETNRLTNSKSSLALYYNNLADVLVKQNRLDSALHYAQESLALATEIGYKRVIARANIIIGSYYIQTKQHNRSLPYLEKGIALAEEIGQIEEAKIGYEQSYAAYKALKQYQQSLQAYEAYTVLKDSMINDGQTKELTRLELEYEYGQKALADSLQNATVLAAQKAESNRRKTISYFLLAGLLFSLIFGLLLWSRFRLTRRQKMIIEQEKAKLDQAYSELNTANEKLRELDSFKSRFFTDISHEFRTPLTIILGMIDQIEKQPKNWLKKGAQMIRRNGSNLLSLINQILDLQKIESGNLNINLQQSDIIPFLQKIAHQFQAFAESKKQQMAFTTEVKSLIMDFDQEKTLRIVSNLLSNAIKYTPEKGKLTFAVDTTDSSLILTVADTGPGIPHDQLPHIFDRFYRVDIPYTGTESGTGIGLSLTQELVKLLQGKIEVSSQEGRGTTFRVSLPITQKAIPGDTSEELNIQSAVFGVKGLIKKLQSTSSDLPIALLVEDNPDIAQYLQVCLEGHYQLIMASNGQEGIDQALEHIPDIIISDVMMPEKNGFELCETLKEDMRTSHIPIILLTAKSGVESRIAGLKQGADDYLAKPFNEEELQVRMQNLLEIRRKLQERYQNVYAQPLPKAKVAATSVEDAFILKIKEIFEDRMIDPDFALDSLSQELNLSRSNLYRKIKALTGRSPSVFLRSLRLQKARQLLLSSNLSVKQVAYDVGFSDPSYFSRTYTEEFGESPSSTGL